MNSQLRGFKDTIRPQLSGDALKNFDVFIDLFVAQQASIKDLSQRVKKLEDDKNRHSGNSSMPPSSDKPWRSPKKRSLREPTDKPAGGQIGHRGQGGKMSDHPDEIVPLVAEVCPHCTHDLSGVPISSTKIKQLVELPPITPTVTEYQLGIKCCPGCKSAVQSTDCPIDHQMEFGPRLKAFCVYLSVYQLVPCQRTTELLQGMLGVSISTGSLDNFRILAARLLGPFMAELKETIRKAEAAYFDETGIRIDGKRLWAHVAATDSHTFYAADQQRGGAAHDRMDILPCFEGIAHHDALPAYNVFTEATHSLCNAHGLGELNGVIDREKDPLKSQWAVDLKVLLKEANIAVDQTKKGKLTVKSQQDYRRKYKQLIKTGLLLHPHQPKPSTQKRGRAKQTKTRNLLLRLQKRRDSYLLFLKDSSASFTNNQAEQDLRMLKVKNKVSGCFRSMKASEEFMAIKSYISTAIKQGLDPIERMLDLFVGRKEKVLALAKIP